MFIFNKPKTPYCNHFIGKKGFSKVPMIPPPSETGDNVIQFELTVGCSHNKCTFCNMYSEIKHCEKSLYDFRDHVDSVLKSIPRRTHIDRIFIGSGNALCVDTELLHEAIQYTIFCVFKKTGSVPRRVSIYGNTMDILKHGIDGIGFLNCGGVCNGTCSKDLYDEKIGLTVVYWGLESGNDEVLKMSGKGYTKNEAIDAGISLLIGGVKTSVMVMPGLGGIKYFDQHIADTIEVLNTCKPEWITFMGLQIKEGTPYEALMNQQEEDGINRPLTEKETVDQICKIIEGLRLHTTIGVHGYDVHKNFCHNPVEIGSIKMHPSSSRRIAREIKREFFETIS